MSRLSLRMQRSAGARPRGPRRSAAVLCRADLAPVGKRVGHGRWQRNLGLPPCGFDEPAIVGNPILASAALEFKRRPGRIGLPAEFVEHLTGTRPTTGAYV